MNSLVSFHITRVDNGMYFQYGDNYYELGWLSQVQDRNLYITRTLNYFKNRNCKVETIEEGYKYLINFDYTNIDSISKFLTYVKNNYAMILSGKII